MMVCKYLKATRAFLKLLPALITLTACVDSKDYEVEGVTATPSMILPLASGNLVVADFLHRDSAYIRIDTDGLVYLSYQQTLKSQDLNQILDFPNRNFSKDIILPPATIPANNNELTYATLNTTLDFAFDPEKLTEMLFKKGDLIIQTNILPVSPAGLSYDVLVDLPDFSLNGVPFSQRISGNKAIDLNGYLAKFTDNVTTINLTFIVKAHSGPIIIPPTSKASVKLDFGGLEYKEIKGFFGDQKADLIPQKIDVQPFNPISDGNISFADPQLSFEVINDYGIPVNVTFVKLEAQKDNASPIAVQLSKPNPIAVSFPTQPVDSAKTLVQVLNSKQLLEYFPNRFFYSISARINDGLTSGNNFCEDVSSLKVRFKAEVPMYGHASNISLSDTTDLDIGDLEGSTVENIFIKTKISNQLPLDATLQFYLANDKYVITDSLLAPKQIIVKSSTVNATGDLVAAGELDQQIPIDKNKIDKIFTASKLIIVTRLNTTKNTDGTQPDVKFKSTYKMNVTLGLKVDLKVKADL